MTISNLKDVYIDQLEDLYSANTQALKMTEKLAGLAHNTELRDALARGVSGINEGQGALKSIIEKHGADPKGEFCHGMEGLTKEARLHAIEADISDEDARDAIIITMYQRMTHYALAGYGCLLAFAHRLDLEDDAKKLQVCLDETYDGDRVMSGIAMGEVNKAAA